MTQSTESTAESPYGTPRLTTRAARAMGRGSSTTAPGTIRRPRTGSLPRIRRQPPLSVRWSALESTSVTMRTPPMVSERGRTFTCRSETPTVLSSIRDNGRRSPGDVFRGVVGGVYRAEARLTGAWTTRIRKIASVRTVREMLAATMASARSAGANREDEHSRQSDASSVSPLRFHSLVRVREATADHEG